VIIVVSGDNVFVAFTMDCERIRRYSPPGGPESWELSERAIMGFVHVLEDNGFSGTFFIVPETAMRHRDLWLELKERGFELALHYHPQSFRNGEWRDYLGGYSYEEQKVQLSEAIKDWSRALGMRPESFRPGNFSANDHTFRVLYDLGFRQGSVSSPERNLPEYKAVWIGANPYPHHVSPTNRLIEGKLDFFEIPATVDRDKRVWNGKNALELRVEMAELDDHKETVDKWLRHLAENDIPIKHVVALTHNVFDYSDRMNEMRKRLEGIINYVYRFSDVYGLNVIPSTIKQIHMAVHEKNYISAKES